MEERKEPRWVPRLAVEAAHLDQLREHGGLVGPLGRLESAFGRPRKKWASGDGVEDAELAAAYAFGISSNLPFRDGNKRAAFLTMMMFLGLNGWKLEVTEEAVVRMMLGLAAAEVSEAELAEWIRGSGTRRGS